MTDYKKYSLEQVKNFLYDSMSTDATPQEIYDVIKGVVQDNYYTYKVQTEKAYELLALLNGNGKGHIKNVDKEAYDAVMREKEYYEPEQHSEYYYDFDRNKPLVTCDKDDSSPECKKSWSSFWEEPSMPPWGHSDIEYGLHYTDKELNAMCDKAEKDQKKTLNYQEAIDAGWTMTDDGIWMPPQKKDKVKKWVLPVELDPSGECYVTLPDDLLETSNLNEGDTVGWINQGDGSYLMKKIEKKEQQLVDENDWNKDYEV